MAEAASQIRLLDNEDRTRAQSPSLSISPEPTRTSTRRSESSRRHRFLSPSPARSVISSRTSPRRSARTSTAEPTTTPTPTSHLEVLYENQRGFFILGVPTFSSSSLLNFDPPAWTTLNGRPSPVDITNAQVPDPSWEWAWKMWYVDMGGDCDEEGWVYAFSFGGVQRAKGVGKLFKGFGGDWKGKHHWWNGFVRRRRWVRLRVKKGLDEKTGRLTERGVAGESTSLLGRTRTAQSRGTSFAPSTMAGNLTALAARKDIVDEDEEVNNVGILFKRLKKASVDREKIATVKRYLEEGGEELHYLAEKMPDIMATLVFQDSRRQLLSLLTQTFDEASRHRTEHDRRGEPEDPVEQRRIDHLLRGVEAADRECKRLEYWSDIKQMVREGNAPTATDENHGWGHGWQGLDDTGPPAPEREDMRENNPPPAIRDAAKELDVD